MSHPAHSSCTQPETSWTMGNSDPLLLFSTPIPFDLGTEDAHTRKSTAHPPRGSGQAPSTNGSSKPLTTVPIQNGPVFALHQMTGSPFGPQSSQEWLRMRDQDGEASRPAKRRKGGKIYSGCATCRLRKIKCDQRRPTCNNCEKSRQYLCDGYRDEDNQANPLRAPLSSVRSQTEEAIPPHTSACADSSSPESDRTNVENNSWDSHGTSIPFDRIEYHDSQPEEWHGLSMSPGTEDRMGFLSSLQDVFPDAAIDFSFGLEVTENASAFATPPQILDNAREKAELPRSPDAIGRPILPQTVSLPVPQLNAIQPGDREGESDKAALSPSLPMVEFHGIPKASRQLLYHYRTHVCQLMMPTAAPSHNPWLQIYLPIALQEPPTSATQALLHSILAVSAFNQAGLRKLEGRSFRAQAVEHSKKAEYIMGTIDYTNTSDHQLIGTEQVAKSKQALLAAALTMTTVDVFSGANAGKCYKHLQTAKDIIENTGGIQWWLSDPANTTLLQIFRCLRIVSDTSGWTAQQREGSSQEKTSPRQAARHTAAAAAPGLDDVRSSGSVGSDELVVTSGSSPYEYTLDVSFGISMKTLWCLNKIVDLATVKAATPRGDCWWEAHTADLLKLESELFDLMEDPYAFSDDQSVLALAAPPTSIRETDMDTHIHHSRGDEQTDKNSPSSSLPSHNSFPSINAGIPQIVTEEIRENHLWAFHYSVALFYRRAICGGGNNTSFRPTGATPTTARDENHHHHTVTPRPTGQYLVSKVLEHLENIDALTVDTPVANTLWPGFIAAVEAVDTELRHRVLVWFARAKRHGIGNIHAAKTLVLEVWRRLDRHTYLSRERKDLRSELGSVDWRDVMREKGMYIMLT